MAKVINTKVIGVISSTRSKSSPCTTGWSRVSKQNETSTITIYSQEYVIFSIEQSPVHSPYASRDSGASQRISSPFAYPGKPPGQNYDFLLSETRVASPHISTAFYCCLAEGRGFSCFFNVQNGVDSTLETCQSITLPPAHAVVKLSCENSIWLSRNSDAFSSSRFVPSEGSNLWHSSRSFFKSSTGNWA